MKRCHSGFKRTAQYYPCNNPILSDYAFLPVTEFESSDSKYCKHCELRNVANDAECGKKRIRITNAKYN